MVMEGFRPQGAEAGRPAVALHGLPAARCGAHVAALRAVGLESVEVVDPVGFLESGRGRLVVVALVSQAACELVRSLAEHDPPAVVVAAVPAATPESVRLGRRYGATAVVDLVERPEELAETVRSAAAGYVRVPAGLASRLFADRPPQEANPPVALSPEEVAWLRALARGATVAELARDGHRSLRTTQRLLHDLFRRMGVAKEVQAVVRASEWGLL